MASNETASTQGGLRPARRTIVKGAAWAVPAIAVATPALAAGASQPISPIGCGNVCKHPGEPKFYHFIFCFTNTSDEPITVYVDQMTINNVSADAFVSCTANEAGCTGNEFVVPANSTVCKHVDAGKYGDSANGSALLTWRFKDPWTGEIKTGTPVSGGTIDGKNILPCKDPVKGDPPHSPIANPSGCDMVISSASETIEEPAVEAPAVEAPAVEAPAVEAPAVEEPAPGADTESTTASPQG